MDICGGAKADRTTVATTGLNAVFSPRMPSLQGSINTSRCVRASFLAVSIKILWPCSTVDRASTRGNDDRCPPVSPSCQGLVIKLLVICTEAGAASTAELQLELGRLELDVAMPGIFITFA
ncbi:hypothetical protein Esti_000244 [Eimeria stiedai]